MHDEPITCAEVVDRGLVERPTWEQVTSAALDVFAEGQEVAAEAGLILADTKYEFGSRDGQSGRLLLIDEVHTPDSSRFWVADSYEARLAAGEEPESLDKEVDAPRPGRRRLRGDGPPPELGPAVIAATSVRYIDAYERLTGGRCNAAPTLWTNASPAISIASPGEHLTPTVGRAHDAPPI